jgi:large subunit ribosomal protein L2
MNKLNNGCIVKLKSKQKVFISNFCFGTKGSINSNIIKRQKYRKASYFIYLGWKSHIRGVAMNPIDHPHGGGQGKTSGGRPSSSPWGWYTKGIKTKTKKYSGKIYLKR